jgi:hypothetical protein
MDEAESVFWCRFDDNFKFPLAGEPFATMALSLPFSEKLGDFVRLAGLLVITPLPVGLEFIIFENENGEPKSIPEITDGERL